MWIGTVSPGEYFHVWGLVDADLASRKELSRFFCFFLELKGNDPYHHFQVYVGVVLSVRHTVGLMCPCEVCTPTWEVHLSMYIQWLIIMSISACHLSVKSRWMLKSRNPDPWECKHFQDAKNYPPVYLKVNTIAPQIMLCKHPCLFTHLHIHVPCTATCTCRC